jgi:hypothetical protein
VPSCPLHSKAHTIKPLLGFIGDFSPRLVRTEKAEKNESQK